MAGFDDLVQGKHPEEVDVKESETQEPKEPDVKEPETTEVDSGEKSEEKNKTAELNEQKTKELPLDIIKEKFGVEVESEDKLKEFFDKAAKADEYASKLEEYETQMEKLKADLNSLDPSKLFASEKDYIAQQLKLKYPDKNPDVLQKIVDGVDDLDDLTVLAYNYLLDDPQFPGGLPAMVDHLKRKYYGEDYDESEIDDFTKRQIRIDASNARKSLKDFANIDVPKLMTAEERQKQYEQWVSDLREKWSPIEVIPAKYEGEIAGKKFEFKYDDDLKEYADVFISASGMEPTEENVSIVREEIAKEAFWRNKEKILEAFANQVKSEVLKKADAEVGNDKPPNRAEATDTEKTKPSGFENFLKNRVQPGTLIG